MIRLRAIHVLSAIAIAVTFAASTALVMLDNFGFVTAALFSFLNIIGTTFPPSQGLVDPSNPFILSAVALGTAGNLAFTIMFTTIFYQILSSVDVRYFISGQRIKRASKHVIVTPINGIGLELAGRLKGEKIGTVFIDEDRQLVRKTIRKGFLAMRGNPAVLETLEGARISNAIAVFALGDNDIGNTFITIAAKKANGKAIVISRIKRLEDLSKMERAGARRIILPEAAVGEEIGEFILSGTRPAARIAPEGRGPAS